MFSNTKLRILYSCCLLLLCFHTLAQSNRQKRHTKNSVLTISKDYNNYVVRFTNSPADDVKASYADSILHMNLKSGSVIINTKMNVFLDFEHTEGRTDFVIHIKEVGDLKICGNGQSRISIVSKSRAKLLTINSICISDALLDKVILSEINIGSFMLEKSHVNFMDFRNARILNQFLLKISTIDSSNFDNADLPELLNIDRVNLSRNGAIDFRKILNLSNTSAEPALNLERVMKIRETDLDKFRLNYDRFSFHVDSVQCAQHRIWIYQKILKHMNAEGQIAQYNIYNEYYKELSDSINHRPITNTINKLWWNKGHNRSKVI